MDASVAFSFCISTRGRTTQIGRLLESLVAIGPILRNDYEVVCVDQNITSALQGSADYYARRLAKLIYLSRPEDRGLSRGRNVGMQHASGRWIVCIDDDAWVNARYACALMDFWGYTEGPMLVVGRTVDDHGHQTAKRWPTNARWVTPCAAWACSGFPMVHRAALHQIGNFDERLGVGTYFGGDEDTDYLLRAMAQGIDVLYTPGLSYVHRSETPSDDKVSGLARGRGALLRKYYGTVFERPLGQALWRYRTDLRIKQALQQICGAEDKVKQKALILNGITEGFTEWGMRYG